MRVGLDLDGMVYDLEQRWLDRINEDYGTSVTKADVLDWDLAKAFEGVVSKEEIYRYLREPGMFYLGATIPGAQEAVQAMVDADDEVVVLSSPSGGLSAKEKLEWLPAGLPMIGESNVMLGAPKHVVRADVLLDDRGKTLRAFADENPGALCAGIEYPYNAGEHDPHRGVHFVKDYTDPRAAWARITALLDQKRRSLR